MAARRVEWGELVVDKSWMQIRLYEMLRGGRYESSRTCGCRCYEWPEAKLLNRNAEFAELGLIYSDEVVVRFAHLGNIVL